MWFPPASACYKGLFLVMGPEVVYGVEAAACSGPCIETLRCGVGEGRDGSGARGAASSQGGFRCGIGMGVLACGLRAAFGPARASNGDGCNNGMRLALWLDSAAAWRQ